MKSKVPNVITGDILDVCIPSLISNFSATYANVVLFNKLQLSFLQ